MHDRPAIRALRGDGGTIRGIAREQSASRNAVRRALAPGAREYYYRPSVTEAVESDVRAVLADYPLMTVSDIAVLIDWRHSRRTLSDLVAGLRPEYMSQALAVAATPWDELKTGSIRAGTVSAAEIDVPELTAGGVTLR